MKQTKQLLGKNQTKHTTEFNSITEFYDYVTKNPENEIFKGGWLSSEKGSEKFTGTETFEDATKLLKNGWEVKAKELETKLKQANINMKQHIKQRAKYDMVGFQASVPRYLQGIPTSMINKKNVAQKQKIVTINKSISYNAGVSTDTIMENSIKALQIIQKIEATGIRCNLNIFWGVTEYPGDNANEVNIMKIRIKSAGERLNISKLAFPLVHPSMLRRLSFKFIETSPTFTRKSYTNGYGYPVRDKSKFTKIDEEYFLPSFIGDVEQTIENILK